MGSSTHSDPAEAGHGDAGRPQDKEDNWSTSAATCCSSGDSSEARGMNRGAHKDHQLYHDAAPSVAKRRRDSEHGREFAEAPSTSGSHPAEHKVVGGHKKQRLLWTSRLHAKFMEAVKLLSLENAVPTKILQLMDEPEVTREQVASHLQKYRLHLKRMAGLPADAPLTTQTKDLMQVTQNVMASSLPTSVLTGMLAALPLSAASTAAGLQSQVLYQLPHLAGLAPGSLAAAGLQPMQLVDSKTGMAASMQQPLLQAFGANQFMALNLLPMNYNPYGLLVMPGSYTTAAGGLPMHPPSPARSGAGEAADAYGSDKARAAVA